MELRFSTELPPGAKTAGDSTYGGKGVNKNEVEAELRSNPGQWALVYESANPKVMSDWRKRDGIEVAHERLPNQVGKNSGIAKYKIWLRYVGVPSTSIVETGLPQPQAPDAESQPVNPQATPSSPTAPLAPGAVTPPPRTAFQAAWAQQDSDPQGE